MSAHGTEAGQPAGRFASPHDLAMGGAGTALINGGRAREDDFENMIHQGPTLPFAWRDEHESRPGWLCADR